MKKRSYGAMGVSLVAIAMLGACGSGATVSMEQGEWETTVTLTNLSVDNLPPEVRNGMGRAPVNQPQTARGCMAATADVIRVQNLRFNIPVPGAGAPAPGCQIAELVMEGGVLRGQMSCTGIPIGPMMMGGAGQPMTMSGQVNGTYTATTAEATAHGEIRFGQNSGSADVRISSRRVGACPAPRPYTPPPAYNPQPTLDEMNAVSSEATNAAAMVANEM